MDFKTYQEESHKTAIYPKVFVQKKNGEFNEFNLAYPALGLGEVGEFQNKAKKLIRDFHGQTDTVLKGDMKKELGDVLWYIAECATALGLDLNEIAEENVAKLKSRQERGVLGGSGDNR